MSLFLNNSFSLLLYLKSDVFKIHILNILIMISLKRLHFYSYDFFTKLNKKKHCKCRYKVIYSPNWWTLSEKKKVMKVWSRCTFYLSKWGFVDQTVYKPCVAFFYSCIKLTYKIQRTILFDIKISIRDYIKSSLKLNHIFLEKPENIFKI